MAVHSLQWGAIYFAVVLFVGFVLGMVRVGLVEPHLGPRWAELAELPLMLVAIVWVANKIVRRIQATLSHLNYFIVGLIALMLLLVTEVTRVLSLRGITLVEYLKSRDPISGFAYLVSLAVFSAMPWAIAIYVHRETVPNVQ
jgi:hypothetical protein